jgi:peptidoglycan hydrolase-like protein with peptidoglycan-binding domain
MKVLVLLMALLAGSSLIAQTHTRSSAPTATPERSQFVADTVAVQVMLDRAGFSPGVIDGQAGVNLKRAINAFQRANGLTEGLLDDRRGSGLVSQRGRSRDRLFDQRRRHRRTFHPRHSADLVAQSKLERLGYRNALEAIAERFHTSRSCFSA